MATYTKITNLKGPKGDKGPQGDKGPKGDKGDVGEAWSKGTIPTADDLNTYQSPGWYAGSGTGILNRPTSESGNLEVFTIGSIVVQRWTTAGSTPKEYARRLSGGVWSGWADPTALAQEGRGILAPSTDLNSLNLPVHNGIWALSGPNWSTYINLPTGISEAARGTLEVISPNNWTVTQRVTPSGGTKRYERVMTSPTGPTFGPWQVIDSVVPDPPTPTIQALPSADWIHWGDSLTDDAALGADAWVTKLAALTGRNHINQGWYGQTAAQIAARQGGNPTIVTVTGGSIPASGTQVQVTSVTHFPSMPVGEQQPTRQVQGRLAGRDGYLVDGGSSVEDAFFMPTAGSSATAATGRQVFTPTGAADTGRARTATLCIGANDIWSHGGTPTHVAHMARQMVNYQSTSVPRVLVLSIPRRAGSGIGTVAGDKTTAINEALREEFPSTFVDVAAYLMSDQAATDAGITYTADDLADIAAGVTPRSFRLTGDSVHYNALGCSIVAPFVYEAARERGWV